MTGSGALRGALFVALVWSRCDTGRRRWAAIPLIE
jgi:hypothetical protein